MTLGAVGVLWAVVSVLAYVLLALVVVAVGVGVPAGIGVLIYQRALVDDLANPVAVGFGAAFFSLLLGLFLFGVVLVYVG